MDMEGDYVMEGGTIVKLADLSALWAEAQVYTSQNGWYKLNSSVVVQLPDFENKEITGKRLTSLILRNKPWYKDKFDQGINTQPRKSAKARNASLCNLKKP